MKSTEFLEAALQVQKERGEQYDKPNGERSMAATVSAFNCITGYTLEESDGWMFMALLKLVRQAQNPEKYHHDSALDLVAYSSLYAEAASEQCKDNEEPNGIPQWNTAPEWANWIALDKEGAFWFEREPEEATDGSYRYPVGSKMTTIHEIPQKKQKIRRPGA